MIWLDKVLNLNLRKSRSRRLLRFISVAVLAGVEHGYADVFCAATEIPAVPVDTSALPARQSEHSKQHTIFGAARNRRLGGESQAVDVELDEASPAAEPEQIHISLATPDSDEEYAITVAWATWPDTQTQVFWSKSLDEAPNVATGSSTSYSTRHPGRTDYTSGFLHSAILYGLEPSTTYYYACGDESMGLSSIRSFATPPKLGADQAITLGILGDLGQTHYSENTLAALGEDETISVVLHAGDLSYADCDQPRWDTFMRMLDPVASRLPWMVAAGNHEIEAGATGGKPFVAYEHRFRMPSFLPPERSYACGVGGGLNGDGTMCWEGKGGDEALLAAKQTLTLVEQSDEMDRGKAGPVIAEAARHVREDFDDFNESNPPGKEDKPPEISCCPSEWSGTYDYGNSYYSFDVASVHVVVLNPYAATGEGSKQQQWVQQDLEAIDRSVTPWVVAVMHCPWYNSNLAHQGERQTATAMRVMEPILTKHKVAVVIAGHVHAYERSYPVIDNKLSDEGPVYLVVGGAGNREGHADGFYPMPEWSAFRDGSAYGSGRLSIRTPELALWEWKSSEEDKSVHDVAWIINPYTGSESYLRGKVDIDRVEAQDKSTEAEERTRLGGGLRIPGLADRRIHVS